MKSRIVSKLVIFFVVAVIFSCFAMWLSETSYSSLKICLFVFLGYFSNVFAILISAYSLYLSFQQETISIETFIGSIRHFIETAHSGFIKSSQGENFRYYRLNYSKFERYLQKLKNADVLSDEDVKLCKKINDCVRNIEDKPKATEKTLQKDKISAFYNEFGNADEFSNKIDEVLKKL